MVAAGSTVWVRRCASRLLSLLLAACLAACAGDQQFSQPGPVSGADTYNALYPYYAEFCALSQIKKKPGFGANIRGEIGGHSVFYLNGACRDEDSDYPVLHVCDPAKDKDEGVGLSVNAHFSNAKFVAIPGHDFFFDGDQAPGQPVTRAVYERVQAHARQMHLYRAIKFHDWVFDKKPADMSRQAFKYEMSIATDYALSLGRGRFCARVPVDRAQMTKMVNYLNSENAPYRYGKEIFHWSVFQDNCIHLAHNTLAVAGIWTEWPTELPLVLAVLDFPVPKNDFVNLMLRTNDPESLDPAELYQDPAVRRSVMQFGRLPWEPGALADSRGPQEPNYVYDTDLKMIFYEDPILQLYQHRFDAILDHPRYYEIEQNLQYFDHLYKQIDAERQPVDTLLAEPPLVNNPDRDGFAAFYQRYYAAVNKARARVAENLTEVRLASQTNNHLVVLTQSGP